MDPQWDANRDSGGILVVFHLDACESPSGIPVGFQFVSSRIQIGFQWDPNMKFAADAAHYRTCIPI